VPPVHRELFQGAAQSLRNAGRGSLAWHMLEPSVSSPRASSTPQLAVPDETESGAQAGEECKDSSDHSRCRGERPFVDRCFGEPEGESGRSDSCSGHQESDHSTQVAKPPFDYAVTTLALPLLLLTPENFVYIAVHKLII
jgi:hypothetical protein